MPIYIFTLWRTAPCPYPDTNTHTHNCTHPYSCYPLSLFSLFAHAKLHTQILIYYSAYTCKMTSNASSSSPSSTEQNKQKTQGKFDEFNNFFNTNCRQLNRYHRLFLRHNLADLNKLTTLSEIDLENLLVDRISMEEYHVEQFLMAVKKKKLKKERNM